MSSLPAIIIPAPWERQAGESSPAWEAFTHYRDMALPRSAERVAGELSKSSCLCRRWCARWRWLERVEAWDAELDREAREGHREAVRLARERQAMIASVLHTAVQRNLPRLVSVQEQAQPDGSTLVLYPERLSPSELARLFEVATRIERQALGMDAADLVSAADVRAFLEELLQNVGNALAQAGVSEEVRAHVYRAMAGTRPTW